MFVISNKKISLHTAPQSLVFDFTHEISRFKVTILLCDMSDTKNQQDVVNDTAQITVEARVGQKKRKTVDVTSTPHSTPTKKTKSEQNKTRLQGLKIEEMMSFEEYI